MAKDEASALNPFSVSGLHIALVGGTAGIGLSVATHLCQQGARVVITGRRDAASTAVDIGATYVPMDVGDGASVAAGFAMLAETMPTVDCLILNAGIDQFHGEIDELDLEAFENVLQINTLGVVRSMARGVKLMSAGGSVIVTSSPAGSIAVPGMAAYSASKAALDMLVRTWALELGPKGIRVNAVLPGIVESEMAGESTGELEVIRRMTANGTYRSADEIAPVFQFLASAASATLTGSAVGAHDGISIGYSHEVMSHLSAELSDQT